MSGRSERWPQSVVLWSAVFGLATMAVRSVDLGGISVLIFDEIFYASDGLDLFSRGVEGGRPAHPPVGKWLIGLGIQGLGFSAWGWRIAALVAGGATTMLAALAAWRATQRRAAMTLAAGFVAIDGVSTVTGRLALLDGFVAMFTAAAVLLLVHIVQAARETAAPARRARFLLGLCIGLAAATKWNAAALLPVAFVTLFAVDYPLTGAVRRRAWRSLVLSVVVVPAVVYTVSHAGFFLNYDETDHARRHCGEPRDASVLDRVAGAVDNQVEVFDYHRGLVPTNPDVASSATWVGQTSPVKLYRFDDRAVYVFGNPLLWVAATVAVLAAALMAIRRDALALLLVALALGYWLPWALSQRSAYVFYAAPLVPVLAVVLAYCLSEVMPSWRPFVGAFGGLAVIVSAWFWPVWMGWPVGAAAIDRILFGPWS